ncbi:MAG: DNA translocase FtsK, partial [Desulfobacteraceae bacterium]
AEVQNDGESPADFDERYDEAVALVTRTGQASISMVQRHLRIGYNRAARIIETMEKEGVVGPSDGVKPREVLARGYDEMP